LPITITLRDTIESDLPVFFEHESDPDAVFMAAFTAKDPSDRDAFYAHWKRILADPTVIIKTILVDGRVAGSVLSYEDEGKPEVSYWIGKEYWGRGIATRALAEFLISGNKVRPIHARAAKDNLASLRVLAKCGFIITGEAKGFANARGTEIEELVLTLSTAVPDPVEGGA
jgi:RimJ/RimL family protein N-acetyltransferase